MRLSLRLAASLVASISLLALVLAYVQVRGEKRSLRRDLERRAAILAEGLKEAIEPHISDKPQALQSVVARFDNNHGALLGIAVYGRHGLVMAATPRLEARLTEPVFAVKQALAANQGRSDFLTFNSIPAHLFVFPLHQAH